MVQRTMSVMAVILVFAGISLPARAGIVVYDNTVSSSDFGFFSVDSSGRVAPSIDDLHVVGGGQLESVTFSMIGQSLGGPVDAQVVLALDNGDGIPDYVVGGGGTDAVILNRTLSNLGSPFIPTGNASYVSFDALADNVAIPSGATIWAHVGFTRFGFAADVDQVFHGPVAVGSTDGFVYKYGSTGIEPEAAPGGGLFDGLGWKLTVVPEPATLSLFVLAAVAALRRHRSSRAI